MSTTGIMDGIDACETSGVGRWVGPEGARGAGWGVNSLCHVQHSHASAPLPSPSVL